MAKIEMIIESVRRGLLKEQWAVILKEKSGERCLPIYVEHPFVDAIKIKLLNPQSTKPWACDLSIPGIDLTASGLESVTIDAFINNVFHSELYLNRGDRTLKINCKVSKALAISVYFESPIYVEETVLDRSAVDMNMLGQ